MSTDSTPDHSQSPGIFGATLLAARRKGWAVALTLIVISAASLSTYWVFLVPIFEAPDEPTHIDYAFNILSAGRLINVREADFPWNVTALTPSRERAMAGRAP